MKFAIDLLPLVSYGTMSFAETSKTSVNLGEEEFAFFAPQTIFGPLLRRQSCFYFWAEDQQELRMERKLLSAMEHTVGIEPATFRFQYNDLNH